MKCIEFIVRSVIFRDHKILLAHKIGENNTFLPGGHIESCEYAVKALERELMEELGVEADVGNFVGVIEHKFTDGNGEYYEEVNLIFETRIPNFKIDSCESHLEFFWADIWDLEKHTLYPRCLPELLKDWIKKGAPFHFAQSG